MARRKIRVDGVDGELQTQTTVALDDQQPTESHAVPEPHSLERLIMLELQTQFSFSSLVVRRLRDGICLQGILHWDEDAPDVTRTAQRIAGVERVINQLVVVREPSKERTRKLPK